MPWLSLEKASKDYNAFKIKTTNKKISVSGVEKSILYQCLLNANNKVYANDKHV